MKNEITEIEEFVLQYLDDRHFSFTKDLDQAVESFLMHEECLSGLDAKIKVIIQTSRSTLSTIKNGDQKTVITFENVLNWIKELYDKDVTITSNFIDCCFPIIHEQDESNFLYLSLPFYTCSNMMTNYDYKMVLTEWFLWLTKSSILNDYELKIACIVMNIMSLLLTDKFIVYNRYYD